MTQPAASAPDSRPNPQKRNLIIRRVARAPWWLLIAAALIVAFLLSVSGDRNYQEVTGRIRSGIWTTIWVTVIAYSIATFMGLVIALLRRSTNVIIYQVTTLFVEVIRGIPTLVLVYYITLALTPELVRAVASLGKTLFDNGILPEFTQQVAGLTARDVPNAARAIVALAVSYSAFLSEIFRAGIESIPHGQIEAGMSMGMTRWQVMRHIVLPQAIRNILPPLGNDFIAMLKESSLVSIVGVEDITRIGATYASATFTFFQSYNVVAITYLILTLSLSMLVKMMEWYLGRGRQREE
ncbi:MAG TPA: amino acid ABC transporter permease [Aggregatilineales bacterium]|jgi:polar amino acid transport system permease protein|nr:amino acid ABC transporter permease [Aggregatilineales bacterium]